MDSKEKELVNKDQKKLDALRFSQKEQDAVLEGQIKLFVLASLLLGRDSRDKVEDFVSKIGDVLRAFADEMVREKGQQIVRTESDLPNQLPKKVIEMAFQCQFIANPDYPDDALRVGYKYLSTYVPDEEYKKALLDKPEHLKQLEQAGETGEKADLMATMLATNSLVKELADLDKDCEKFVASVTHGKHTLETLREFLSSVAKEHYKKFPRP